MTAESFDAVLAEMRLSYNKPIATSPTKLEFADRLQAAHERAKACWDQRLADEGGAMLAWQGRAEIEQARADRAVGLLQRWAAIRHYADLTVLDETDAFLSEQAGERENATKESAHED